MRGAQMRHRYCTNVVVVLRFLCFASFLLASSVASRGQSSQPSVSPIFSLTANGDTTVQAYQGWALLLDGELAHPDLYSTSVLVSVIEKALTVPCAAAKMRTVAEAFTLRRSVKLGS